MRAIIFDLLHSLLDTGELSPVPVLPAAAATPIVFIAPFKVQRYLEVKGQRNKSSGGNTHPMKINDGYHQEWGSERSQVDRTNQKITC